VSLPLESGLDLLADRLGEDRHLSVLVTTRSNTDDPSIAVVNAGLIDHPVDGRRVLAFVARRGVKLTNLRRAPRATLVARAGWEWVAATGNVELAGPDDPHPDIPTAGLPGLLRRIYHAAGGHHPDLDTYDRVMHDERRCAVLVTPDHVWSNPQGSEHIDP
jgi:PPOX class probable F420-dependent enzyme